jgi:hypothetical protein
MNRKLHFHTALAEFLGKLAHLMLRLRMSTAIYEHWRTRTPARKNWQRMTKPWRATGNNKTISFSSHEKGAQRSCQRERITDSKGQRSLARGLGTAAVPKSKKAVESAETQPPVYFQAARAGCKFAAFLS